VVAIWLLLIGANFVMTMIDDYYDVSPTQIKDSQSIQSYTELLTRFKKQKNVIRNISGCSENCEGNYVDLTFRKLSKTTTSWRNSYEGERQTINTVRGETATSQGADIYAVNAVDNDEGGISFLLWIDGEQQVVTIAEDEMAFAQIELVGYFNESHVMNDDIWGYVVAAYVDRQKMEATEKQKEKQQNEARESMEAHKLDAQWLFEKYNVDAIALCSTAIENKAKAVAKWNAKWNDDWMIQRFPRIKTYMSTPYQITILGNSMLFENGFGGRQAQDYSCEYNVMSKQVVTVRFN